MHICWQTSIEMIADLRIRSIRQLTIWPVTVLLLSILFTVHLPAQKSTYQEKIKIVLDPGHGGRDPGTSGKYSKEKDIALDLALMVGQHLKDKSARVEIIYTRTEDQFVELNKRVELANKIDADLFVSLHCNAMKNSSKPNGIETYVMGLHATEENLMVAKRENAAILFENDQAVYGNYDPYSVEGHILLSAMQNNYLDQSIQLALSVQKLVSQSSSLRDRGVKQAGFVLLRMAQMPSILVEVAFLSNPRDEKLVTSIGGQNEISAAIAMGILRYLANRESIDREDNVTNQEALIASNEPPSPIVDTRRSSVYDSDEMVDSPSKTVYKVQLASIKNKENLSVDHELLSLKNVEVSYEDGLYKFLVGSYDTLQMAVEARSTIRTNGFKGAFVVAYQNGKRIKI